ncbi:tol-pal system protein YbgF [Marinicella rhabdoformis]|uniref:tol-pal system protein YbgF n=1 Tax=Marinicella rhabdoformis TaxID=2580566 RepID=UPI0012AECBDF|nr:tol-pal system protein YbgF [Marinicella rhabdoformis]
MKKTTLFISTLIILGTSVLGAASAQKLSIQERLSKLEQQSGGSGNAADLVYQIQQLQQQLAQMQGTIEEQNHQINQLKERQKVLYVDMDSRITHIEEAMGGKPKNELTEDSAINDDSNQATTQAVTIAAPVIRPTVDAQVNTQTLNNSNVTATSEPVETAAKTQYLAAFNELKAGRSNESSRLFEDFIQAHPNTDLTDNAYYWLGESYYVSRNYPLALAAFQNLEQKFPLSSKLADALLKIGYTYHELEDYAQAQTALEKVVDSFPNQPVARMAEKRLNLLRREGKLN